MLRRVRDLGRGLRGNKDFGGEDQGFGEGVLGEQESKGQWGVLEK